MNANLAPRAQRVGGVEVAPGRSAVVRLGRAGEEAGSDAITAWMAVGRVPGPRVSVIAAAHGHEVAAALAARALIRQVEPAGLRGTLVVVPVFRPGDRFARPGRTLPALALPGDAGGSRRARLTFALYSDLVVSAQQVIALGGPAPGRHGLLVAEGLMDDGRTRKLAAASGAEALVPVTPVAGSLLAAAAEAGRIGLRLAVGSAAVAEDSAALLAAVRRVLASIGVIVHPEAAEEPPARLVGAPEVVRAPEDGMLEGALAPGAYVRKGGALARVAGVVPGAPRAIAAPAGGVVLEAPARPAARRGARLFVVARAPAPEGRRTAPPAAAAPGKLRAGWLERVSLPDLGISRLPAKLDTGARTSALHVISRKVVATTAGPQRRPILELSLPAGGSSRRRLVARTPVKEFALVRDTSGRIERRPVIETTLELGPVRRRIRVTLTDRGDMQFPMLVGRTALGVGFVVDPSARHLLEAGVGPEEDAAAPRPARPRGRTASSRRRASPAGGSSGEGSGTLPGHPRESREES